MSTFTEAKRRTAAAPSRPHSGPVTLINCFVVAEGRETDFERLWATTSAYFRAQPGFISLRLHRALSPGLSYRFVNVAEWASAEEFDAAHQGAEFAALISQPEWREFPNSPGLFEVATQFRSAAVAAAR